MVYITQKQSRNTYITQNNLETHLMIAANNCSETRQVFLFQSIEERTMLNFQDAY